MNLLLKATSGFSMVCHCGAGRQWWSRKTPMWAVTGNSPPPQASLPESGYTFILGTFSKQVLLAKCAVFFIP